MCADPIKLTVQVVVDTPIETVWKSFTSPDDIVLWNCPSSEWHTTKATHDVKEGGRFSSTMAARDGSESFDITGSYTHVELHRRIDYTIDDGRTVQITFTELDNGKKTEVMEVFEPGPTHPLEGQHQGWQTILDNFKKHTEAKAAVRQL